MGVTRRSALKRIALALGGLGSVAATGFGLTRGSTDEGRFTLHGRGWHIYGRNLSRGQLPDGESMLSYGDLFAPDGDDKVGEFAATYTGLPRPAASGRLASLEQHVFTLPGGSLFGSGMTAPGFETLDEFAIVGGTGEYAGARGTYTVRQSHIEFGGDGTAVIEFRLMNEATS